MSVLMPETAQERADREILERLNEPQNLHVLGINSGYRALMARARQWTEADAPKQNVDPTWTT